MKTRLIIVSIFFLTVSFVSIPVQPVEAKTLNWASGSDFNSMDPYSQTMTNTIAFLLHIYDPLVRYNQNLKIEPALATSWKVIEPSVWRFSLRKGVKFHNGNLFNADDVVASIKRVTDPRCVLRGNVPVSKMSVRLTTTPWISS